MFALGRLLTSLAALGVSWSIVLISIVVLGWWAWDALAEADFMSYAS